MPCMQTLQQQSIPLAHTRNQTLHTLFIPRQTLAKTINLDTDSIVRGAPRTRLEH